MDMKRNRHYPYVPSPSLQETSIPIIACVIAYANANAIPLKPEPGIEIGPDKIHVPDYVRT